MPILKENLVKALQSDGSESDSSSDSSGSSAAASCSASDFGLGETRGDKAVPKKRLSRKTPPLAGRPSPKPATASSPAAASSTETPKNAAGQKGCKKSASQSNTLQDARTSVKEIEQVTALAIWKGTLKTKEINSRVTRASTLVTQLPLDVQLKKISEDEAVDAETIRENLSLSIVAIPAFQDLCAKVQGAKGIRDFVCDSLAAEEFVLFIEGFPVDHDTLANMLLTIGQKLLEDIRWSGIHA
jgi:hypothetical protein